MKNQRGIGEALGLVNYRHPDGFGKMMGYKRISINPKKGMARSQLKILRKHLSVAGRVHGGVVSAFFDHACGAALFGVLGPKDFGSTVELKVNYFKPLELGDVLLAETKVIFQGKRLCVIHGFMFRRGDKKPVAMATATFNIVRN